MFHSFPALLEKICDLIGQFFKSHDKFFFFLFYEEDKMHHLALWKTNSTSWGDFFAGEIFFQC